MTDERQQTEEVWPGWVAVSASRVGTGGWGRDRVPGYDPKFSSSASPRMMCFPLFIIRFSIKMLFEGELHDLNTIIKKLKRCQPTATPRCFG